MNNMLPVEGNIYVPGNSGIVNLVNTCYMNSAVQVISHLYPLQEYLLQNEESVKVLILKNAPKFFSKQQFSEIITKLHRKDYTPRMLSLDEATIILNSTMTYQLIKLLKGLWSDNQNPRTLLKRNASIAPVNFKHVFSEARENSFAGQLQHDAEEGYGCIIQKMNEELSTNVKLKIKTCKASVDELQTYRENMERKIELIETESAKQDLRRKLNEKKKSMPSEKLILKSHRAMKKYYDVTSSIITKQLSGFFQRSTSCPDATCGHVSNKFEAYLHISFAIPDCTDTTIYDCMSEYCKEETLDDDNKWNCKRCKKNVCGVTKMHLWTVPEILVIQLKRFNFELMKKNSKIVHFPVTGLNIESMVSQVNIESMHNKSFMYDLHCVINHEGGVNCGHYYALCKNKSDGVWYRYNDTNVTKNSGKIVTSAAYMLFYFRRNTD